MKVGYSFVDIGGIDDRHCLKVLFRTTTGFTYNS